LHDPEFRSRVRQHHLYEVGRRIRLKQDIDLLYQFLSQGFDNYYFDFYVLSAAPTEVIRSALETSFPRTTFCGTDFSYHPSGEINTITQVTAGFGKVAALDRLQTSLKIPRTASSTWVMAARIFTSCCT